MEIISTSDNIILGKVDTILSFTLSKFTLKFDPFLKIV